MRPPSAPPGGFTLYVVARYFYRRGRLMNLLAAVAIVYLLWDPSQLFEAGFQLIVPGGCGHRPARYAGFGSHLDALRARAHRNHRTEPRPSPCAARRSIPPGTAAAGRDLELLHSDSRGPGAERAFAVAARICFYGLRTRRDLHRHPDRSRSAHGHLLPSHLAYRPLGQHSGGPAARAGGSAGLPRRSSPCGEFPRSWPDGSCARAKRSPAGTPHLEPDWRVLAPPLWLGVLFHARRCSCWPWPCGGRAGGPGPR